MPAITRSTSDPASCEAHCGVAPIPASSDKTTRHRLNRGGNGQANSALSTVMLTRMQKHQPTKKADQKGRGDERGTRGLASIALGPPDLVHPPSQPTDASRSR